MRINPGTSVPDDVQSSVQIANDLGEQVVNLVPSPRRTGARPAERRQRAGRAEPGAGRRRRRRRLGHPAAPGHPGQRPQQADRRAGHVAGRATPATCARSSVPGTTFSKEFVAYQQQFTELLANAPPSLDAVTAVAPELRQDLANTAALVQVLAQQKTGLHTLLTSGSSAFNAGGQPPDVAVGQPRLLPARHRRHPVQPRPADQPDQPVAGPRVQPVLLRRRRQDRRRRRLAKPTTNSPRRPEPDVPAHPPAPAADPRRAGVSPTARPTPSPTRCPAPAA